MYLIIFILEYLQTERLDSVTKQNNLNIEMNNAVDHCIKTGIWNENLFDG